jgi:hypothetical protein
VKVDNLHSQLGGYNLLNLIDELTKTKRKLQEKAIEEDTVIVMDDEVFEDQETGLSAE